MNRIKPLLVMMLLALVALSSACGGMSWREPAQGTIEIKTIYGQFNRIIRPEDGGVWENWWGDDYFTQHVTTITEEIPVRSQTKDNARVTLTIQLSYRRATDEESVKKYTDEFGLNEEAANAKFKQKLDSLINKYGGNLSSSYSAYELNDKKDELSNDLEKLLKNDIFPNQLHAQLELLQIKGAPDFENDDIENASGKVVANQKLKEAAEAAYQADIVENKRKELQVQQFQNPTLFEIRKLELQKEIAQAWSQHQGTLVFGGGNSPIQLPSGK